MRLPVHLALSLLSIAVLGGCLMGPDYEEPAPDPEAVFKSAGFEAPWPEGSWWTLFEDPDLERLITEAESANPTAAAALARYDQARAALGLARADAFPAVSGDASARRQEDSRNVNFSVGTYSDFRAALNLSWEIDLWGRVRRQVRAARAEEKATAHDLDAALLSLRAEVVRTYLSLRFADLELLLLEETEAQRAESRRVLKARFDAGQGTRLDFERAVTEHETMRSELDQLRARRGRLENALATLSGQSASSFRLEPSGRRPSVADLPSTLPSEMLRRRPDFAAAERRLASASERIGVVVASFLPRLTLTGFGGFQSLQISDLFDSTSRLWRLGPELSVPVFQGGRSGRARAQAEAAYRAALAEYRGVYLRAVQETEDSLLDARLLRQASISRRRGAESARQAAELTRKRYTGGVAEYFEVVDAERTSFVEGRAVLSLELAQLLSATRLVEALGGGWTRESEGEVEPPETVRAANDADGAGGLEATAQKRS